MRVYIVGAHSTGKTTLARYIAQKYHLTMLPEVARAVLAEMETTLETLRAGIDVVDKYQTAVFARQLQAEKAAKDHFVSDRAFDNLAYAGEHSRILHDLADSEGFRWYVKWLRSADAIFFVRPHRELLREDGVRERTNWDSIMRIDGMVKLLLEMNDIPYLPVESASMQERTRVVDYVLCPPQSKKAP